MAARAEFSSAHGVAEIMQRTGRLAPLVTGSPDESSPIRWIVPLRNKIVKPLFDTPFYWALKFWLHYASGGHQLLLLRRGYLLSELPCP